MRKTNSNGFIALISVIIITLILFVTIITLSITGFLNRFNILEGEAKETSAGLAAACLEMARIKIARDPGNLVDPGYTGGEYDLIAGDNYCDIISVTNSAGGKTVRVRGEYKNAVTNYEVGLDSTQNITSWLEKTSF